MVECPPVSLDHLKMLSCLKTLMISNSNNAFWPVEDGNHAQYQFPVECFCIMELASSGKEITRVLPYMPKLSELQIDSCHKITGLGVVEQEKKATSSSNGVEGQVGWQQNSREEEEEIAVDEGLLLLPPQLHKVEIWNCPELSLIPHSVGLQAAVPPSRATETPQPQELTDPRLPSHPLVAQGRPP
uniref:NB-ARC domain-containing protein n=1 Tax=Arundo donax TaxID=35708 RepID=A0A0A9DK35_ARUDO